MPTLVGTAKASPVPTVGAGRLWTYVFRVDDGGLMTVTMFNDDYPAVLDANITIIRVA
jgi:hypothetical protein